MPEEVHIHNLPTRNLDVLRALAVLCVFADHLVSSSYPSASVIQTWNIVGRIGVLFFFIHTSYVLMHSLERLTVRVSTAKAFITFYIRRVLRIYPLAMVMVVILAFIGAPYAIPAIHMSSVFWGNFFLVETMFGQQHIIPVFWTLPIEVEMYLLLPLCFLAARKSIRLAILLLILSMSLGLYVIPIGGEMWSVAYFAPCFLGSVLAYSLLVHMKAKALFPGKYWVLALAGLSIVLGVLVEPSSDRSIIYGWFFAVPLALLIPYFKDMSPSLLSRASHVIATYSYGIYLVHIPAIKLAHGSWIEAILYTAILSFAAYHLIEAPAIRLGQRLTSAFEKETETLTSVPVP